jgi:hypothetical protein
MNAVFVVKGPVAALVVMGAWEFPTRRMPAVVLLVLVAAEVAGAEVAVGEVEGTRKLAAVMP